MIRFDCASSIAPDHLSSKISKTIFNKCMEKPIIISTRLKWGETNPQIIQNALSSYANDTSVITYVFLITDNSQPFIVPENVMFFRTSLCKSTIVKNEYPLPFIWECQNSAFEPLSITIKPIVGFCGLISQPRLKTLQLIHANPNITTNFIIRDQFWGGRPHDPALINDFLENIRTSHFTVCNRGAGNFSMRFYQTLACGRIPALVNTDMIFPFHNLIDWNSIIIVADSEEKLVEKIIDCWSTRDIIAMQHKCREVFDIYFEGTKYFDSVLLSPFNG